MTIQDIIAVAACIGLIAWLIWWIRRQEREFMRTVEDWADQLTDEELDAVIMELVNSKIREEARRENGIAFRVMRYLKRRPC